MSYDSPVHVMVFGLCFILGINAHNASLSEPWNVLVGDNVVLTCHFMKGIKYIDISGFFVLINNKLLLVFHCTRTQFSLIDCYALHILVLSGGSVPSGLHVVFRRTAGLEDAAQLAVRDRRPPDADGRPAASRARECLSRQAHTRFPESACVRLINYNYE